MNTASPSSCGGAGDWVAAQRDMALVSTSQGSERGVAARMSPLRGRRGGGMHLLLLLDPADVMPGRNRAVARAGRPDSDML